MARKSGGVVDCSLLTWWMWPEDKGILICMWLARLWLSGYRSGMLWCVVAVSWGYHPVRGHVCVCVWARECALYLCVCVFECKTSSVAAGVKVAQAVNSTHSRILSLTSSPTHFFFFFSDLVLHCCTLLICICSWHPCTSHKQPL